MLCAWLPRCNRKLASIEQLTEHVLCSSSRRKREIDSPNDRRLTPIEGTSHQAEVSIARRSTQQASRRDWALAGLNFGTRHGESLRLLGLNGASKTTSISILASEQRPSAGDALLLSPSIRGERQAVRQMIGVAPKEIALYPMLSGRRISVSSVAFTT